MHTLIQGQPDVCVRELTQEDRFVIMATQGVWKFLTKQEAVELVGQVHTPNCTAFA
jgi:serine/threonine protein phosphatase PrpC